MDGLTKRIPDGYSAADLFPGGTQPLRVCVIVRAQAEPVGGRLVLVRDVLDASVCLGCVLDASDSVVSWNEIWVQRVDSIAASAGGGRGELTNASLETRWRRTVDGLETTAPDMMVRTGWEDDNPPALGIDIKRGTVRAPMHEATGENWDICRDEDVLSSKGLGSYRSSLDRYLWVAKLGAESPFVDAHNPDAIGGEVLTGVNRELAAFNFGGGLMMVRRLAPIGYADQVDVIGGRSWSGVRHGVEALDLRAGHGTVVRATGFAGDPEPIDPDRLFLGRHGRWGRLVESLHLKVKMLAESVRAVRAAVEQTGRPLLNMTDESFRIEMWEAGVGLPRLWTTRVRLVDPGTAHAMSVGAAGGFVSPDGIGRGIYRPEIGGGASSGRCDFRIRSIDESGPSGSLIEATFRTDARVADGGSDLLELRVPLDGERVLLYGRVRSDQALGPGELRFRSEPISLDGVVGSALRAAEGVALREVSFEVVPLASTPCDLHALGVLGVRTLLVNGGNTLAVALDELVSLGRQAATERESDGSLSLEDAFERAFFSDSRWMDSIGPQRLVIDEIPPSQAVDMIPPEIWIRTLATLCRMLLGVGSIGFCRDIGDTRGLSSHVVFDGALEELSGLLVRTRSLIVVDWRHNREVHSVIRAYREGMSGTATASGGA